MGYTLELRAGSVERVAQELRRPTLTAAEVRARSGADTRHDDDVEEVLARWPELAGAAAAGIAEGGGDVDGLLATYLHVVVRHLTHWYGAVAHTSSGGEDFRARLLPGPAAVVLGGELVQHLVTRDVAGLRASTYPMVGWASNAELRGAAAVGLVVPEGDAQQREDASALWTLVDAVERAAAGGLDLVGVYA
ncbi:hypothetical protein ICW40_12010 [Actinotalea ferrariae]|uniref:hypothetical protein n=1 Tax=Actinotalea ferrariae TaxID=1386098 RepID=UPI001C8C7F0C|nr:hypothetical protein [Actinotalea ferrariae]MBX9245527.1 hypothetical protein [Actinotalea ferrariae]